MHFSAPVAATAVLAALSLAAGCRGDSPADDAADSRAAIETAPPVKTAPLTAYEPGASICGPDGMLRGRLFGAVAADLDWAGSELRCEGMPRPRGEGARLRFAGSVTGAGTPLAIIIAMPSLEPGEAMSGVPSKVTLIEEGRGRFFSASDLDTCWSDVTTHPVPDDSSVYRVEGVLYCIAPLVEVGGESSVTLDDLEFVGQLGWESG